MVEVLLAQWVAVSLVVAATVAHDVDGGIHSLAHRVFVCHALTGDVVACSVVGAGAHDRQTCGEVHTLAHRQSLERSQTLVVIHGQHTIEVAILLIAKEAVGSVRAETENLLIVGFLNGWRNHLFLLLAEKAVFTSVWIEREHGDAWTLNVEITLERLVEDSQLLQDALFGDGGWHLSQWLVNGDECHTHLVAEKHHQRLFTIANAGFEILGVAGETKFRTLNIFLTDRRCHYRVDITVLQVGDSSLKSQKCGTAGLLVGFTHFHFNVFLNHFHQIWQMVLQLCGRFSDIDLICLHIDSLAMIGENFARPINHRSAKLLHCRVCESFQNHFAANSIGVPLGNANAYFLFVCH